MGQAWLISAFVLGLLLTITGVGNCSENEIIPGGISAREYQATHEIRELIKNLNPPIEAQFVDLPGTTNVVSKFRPISYRTQLVNGVNYFVKVGARTPNKVIYYHLRIFKSFGGQPELVKIQGPKKRNDSITFF